MLRQMIKPINHVHPGASIYYLRVMYTIYVCVKNIYYYYSLIALCSKTFVFLKKKFSRLKFVRILYTNSQISVIAWIYRKAKTFTSNTL